MDDNNFDVYENSHKEASVILGFNCNQETKQINEISFLAYKDVDQFLNSSSANGFCSCFGIEVHRDMFDETYILDALFNKACISFNIIKTSNSNIFILERKTPISVERRNISNYLQIIRKSSFQSVTTLNQIWLKVSSLHNLIGPFSSIECDIDFTTQQNNVYHMVHGHLDWKWLMLTILLKVEIQSNRGNVILEGTKFEKMFKIILYDLLQFAIKRFNKVKIFDLYESFPFPCECFKEFWMLLYKLLENNGISFWNQLSMCLKLIDDGTNIYELYNEPILNRKFKQLEVTKYDVFTVWIYSYLSQTIGMFDSNIYTTSCKNDYDLLEKLTNGFLFNNPSEQELRVYLFNLKNIVIPWQSNIEILMSFWNYYHKQLNSPCGLSGSTASYISAKNNCEEFLNCIKKNCLQKTLTKNQTSFTMFTNILSSLVEHLKVIQKQNQIDKILGRIYSRLPQSKLVILAETGLNNTASLLITLCLATDNREVLNKVCDIIMQYSIEKQNETRQNCVIKIHMVLIILLIEHRLNIESYLGKLLNRINDIFYTVTDEERKPFHILKMLFDGFITVFQNDGPFTLGEHIFFGPWIVNFLNYASIPEIDRLFDISNRILLQIHRNDDEDSEKLYNLIYENLCPFVKKKFATLPNSMHIVTLASNLCACYRDRSKFENIVNDFVETDCSDSEKLLQFWNNLIKSENAFYIKQSLIIKSWIKCCLLTINEEDNNDLKEFSLYVFELEEFKEMCSNSSQDAGNFTVTKFPLHTFFHRIETTYTQMISIAERSKLINKFQYYFTDFEKWIPPNTITSREMMIKLYKMISNLILFCGSIAYQRQTPSNVFNRMMEKYVLPLNLLMGRKTPDLIMTQSIHFVFPMLIYGISKLDYMRDAQLKMYLSNLIEKWFPHFHMVSNKTDVVVKPFVHICNKCDGSMLSFVCRKLAVRFIIEKDPRQQYPQASLAITVFKEMFSVVKQKEDNEKLCILVESTLYDLMVHAFSTNEATPSNKSCLLYFVEITEFMKQNKCPTQIKDVYMNSIRSLVKSNLSYQTEACFKFIIRIVKLNPSNGMDLLLIIKTEVAELEKIRKNDTFLQNLFTKFEKTLRELCKNSK